MKALILMLAVANQCFMVYGDCGNKTMTMECCGEEQVQCPEFIHECREMGAGTSEEWHECHIQVGWLILLIIGCWIVLIQAAIEISKICGRVQSKQINSDGQSKQINSYRQVRAL